MMQVWLLHANLTLPADTLAAPEADVQRLVLSGFYGLCRYTRRTPGCHCGSRMRHYIWI
uniref:RxLR effector candidate protein n=1 Tax=Hyaloperonospora arabidopsidis (strain Emoy2) TaxID=559515 RepID=M4B4R5_HYAAE